MKSIVDKIDEIVYQDDEIQDNFNEDPEEEIVEEGDENVSDENN